MKKTVATILKQKSEHDRITMLTAMIIQQQNWLMNPVLT